MNLLGEIGIILIGSFILGFIDNIFDKNPFTYKGFLRKSLIIFIGLFIVLLLKKFILPPPPKPPLKNEEPNIFTGWILGILIFGYSLYLSIRAFIKKKK